MNSLFVLIPPQTPSRSSRFSVNRPMIAFAVGVLSAAALLPGAQAAAQVTASPSSISWYKVAVGNTGGAKTATLTNGGSSAVSISSIGFIGADPQDFAIYQKTCGSTLSASASCTASIVFRPTTAGTRTADLAFYDSGSNSPQEIAVSGIGTSTTSTGTASVSPTSLSWYKVTVGNTGGGKSVTLTNTGSTVINISGISLTGTNSSDFFTSANTCGSSLAVSASCSLSVYFRPLAGGTRTATLTFTDDASNSPQQVSLSGLGVASASVTAAPASLAFGNINAGSTSASQTITVSNGTSGSVSLSPGSISGANPGDFAVTSTSCGSSLAASASCTASIAFKPIAAASYTANWTMTAGSTSLSVALSGTGTTNSSDTATVSPTSLSWYKVTVGNTGGAKSVTLTNSGSSAISISSISIAGTDSGDFFTGANTCGSSLAASANCSVYVYFRPVAAGTRTATLNFSDNASNNPQQVPLSGLGVAPASVIAAPTSLSFGSISAGSTSASQTITVSNGTTSSVSLSAGSISGTNPADFGITSTSCGSSLAASASCTASIDFTPAAAASYTATWTMTAGSTALSVALSGTGTSTGGTSTGTTYYVSNCGTIGSDSNNGTSTSTPWKTIAKVNSSTFKPGDNIEFHDGCTWREELIPPSNGTVANPITITTYGSGNPPLISGSEIVSSWNAEPHSPVDFSSDSNLQANWTMDQMSGSSFLDSSSNGNTLSNTNGVTQSTNHVQGSYSAAFTASSGMKLTRSDAALSSGFVGKSGTTNTDVTIGGWVYFNSLAPDMSFFLKGTGKSWGLFLGVAGNVDKMQWQTYLNSNFRQVASNFPLSPDTWYHVVGRVDSATGEQALFINGVKQNQIYNAGGAAMFTDSTPVEVGGTIYGHNLDGDADELFVFNRALSDTEIATIYSGGLDGSRGAYTLYYATANPTPAAVYENSVAMSYVAEKAGMIPGSWSWDSADNRVYIRPTGDVDPSTETFEIPQRLTCISDYRNYTTISGLSCQEPKQKGVLVTGQNVTVQNMLIKNVRSNGPTTPNNNAFGVGVFWNGSHDIIQNNTVAEANWGIFSNAVAGQTVDSGLIQSNMIYNIGYDAIGFAVAPNGGILSNTLAQYNVIHDIGIYNLEGGAIECIFGGSTLGTGNIFRYNSIYHNGTPSLHSYAMNVQGGAGGCSFYANVVYDNYGPCATVANGPGGNRFYNNVCYENGLAGREGAGFFVTGGSGNSGNLIENNIVYAGPDTIFMDDSAGATSNTFDYNLYYGGNSTPFTWNGTAYSMANYLAASGQDAHSLNADPQFTNPSAFDFSLTSSSPAIGAGVNLGSTYQFDLAPGSVWPSNVSTASQNANGAWDIGAYVYPQ